MLDSPLLPKLALVLCLALFLSACATPGGDEPPGMEGPVRVQSLLSQEEFQAAGLDQLDEGQLEALNQGLSRALSGEEGRPVDEEALAAWERSREDELATFGMHHEHPNARRHDRLESRLEASVEDWSRGQRIELENGQVWSLVENAGQAFGLVEAGTGVEIRRRAFGSFSLHMEGSNRSVRVRRED